MRVMVDSRPPIVLVKRWRQASCELQRRFFARHSQHGFGDYPLVSAVAQVADKQLRTATGSL
jgi:hypothetical protein